MSVRRWLWVILIGLVILLFLDALGAPVVTQSGFDPSIQTPELMLDEARTVYLGNLARRDAGLPPLRWNQQLTYAARWFSWDSVTNRPEGFCGHQDSQGNWPDLRARLFGYLGIAGAENAYCGYVTPAFAIQGWLGSPGHRANLLNPDSREIGLGYYRRSDGRGYVTQDFGQDPAYPPVIIENEAISTTTPLVTLYVYDRIVTSGFAGYAPATEIMVSNDACFTNASWSAFTKELTWQLEPGRGWRTVYVKTRDAFHRTLTASDAIFLGEPSPDELLATPLSTNQPQVTLFPRHNDGFPQMQFSLGWLADDAMETFEKWWGKGERVEDPEAWGGTAFRLIPGDGETFAWVWDVNFPQDIPMTAYFRLKVNDNNSTAEVARIAVKGGTEEFGPIKLRGVDFVEANRYQEFPLNFTFKPDAENPYLFFKFWRTGSAEVFVDVVTIFDRPRPVQSPFIWSVPGGNYRGQGIWVRYTDGTRFSPIMEAPIKPSQLQVSPNALTFMASQANPVTAPRIVQIHRSCSTAPLEVSVSDQWLHTERQEQSLRVWVDATGLPSGNYTGFITLRAADAPTASIRVELILAENIYRNYISLIER